MYISKIKLDAQVRESINPEVVEQYAEAMTDGVVFPPVEVFTDGTEYHLADGYHRVMAATRNQFTEIPANIRPGTRSDALWYALGANQAHGLRMSRADVRQAISLAVREFPNRSNREIAKQIGCSHVTVGDERKALETVGQVDQLKSRTGADGKQYPATRITSATLNPVLDGDGADDEADEPGNESHAHPDDDDRFKLTAKSIAEKAVYLLSGIKPKDKYRTEALNRVIAYCKKELRRASR